MKSSSGSGSGGLRSSGSEKYYGNGTVAVWSFVTGALQVSQVTTIQR